MGLHGSYQLRVVVYVEGGGLFIPEEGVDLAADSDVLSFDGSPLDVTSLALVRWGADGRAREAAAEDSVPPVPPAAQGAQRRASAARSRASSFSSAAMR